MPASRPAFAAFDLGVGAAGLAAIGLLALVSGQPMLFPSLGPTLMLTLDSPHLPSARPGNALVGHYVGIAAGVASLAVTGLLDAPPVLQAGVTLPRIAAAALSLGLTAAVLRLLRSPHPPAGATTLIVSLGLMTTVTELVAIAVSVAALTAVCQIVDWLRPKRFTPSQ